MDEAAAMIWNEACPLCGERVPENMPVWEFARDRDGARGFRVCGASCIRLAAEAPARWHRLALERCSGRVAARVGSASAGAALEGRG